LTEHDKNIKLLITFIFCHMEQFYKKIIIWYGWFNDASIAKSTVMSLFIGQLLGLLTGKTSDPCYIPEWHYSYRSETFVQSHLKRSVRYRGGREGSWMSLYLYYFFMSLVLRLYIRLQLLQDSSQANSFFSFFYFLFWPVFFMYFIQHCPSDTASED